LEKKGFFQDLILKKPQIYSIEVSYLGSNGVFGSYVAATIGTPKKSIPDRTNNRV
jgi:hypothetical protein